MINLLSPSDKKGFRAARRNTIWSRYTFMIIALLIAVNIILVITIFYIQNMGRSYEVTIADNEQLSTQQYKETKVKADAFRAQLATAKIILDGETNYSTVIVAIAQTTPSHCSLSSLSLSNQFFDTPQSLSFKCLDPPDILRLKTALENNTKYFDKVNIVSTSPNIPSGNDPYRITITMSLLLKKTDTTGRGTL